MKNKREAKSGRGWPLGKLIPLLLTLVFVSDRALRRAPVEWTVRRPWEALLRKGRPPFLPNQSVVSSASVGDLVILGNLPDEHGKRTEGFTTDSLGYRNRPDLVSRPKLAGLVLGDSFTWGAGLDDSETITAQLSTRYHLDLYNAGSAESPQIPWVLDMIRTLRTRGGTVVYVYAERTPLPLGGAGPKVRHNWLTSFLLPWNTLVNWLRSAQDGYSPLQIWSEQAMRRLQNGFWLPNGFADNVVVDELSDGRQIAFYKLEIEIVTQDREVNVNYWRELKSKLAVENCELLVLLVPSKYGVYYPMLRNPSTPPPHDFISLVQKALEAQAIRTVNLGPVLRRRAGEAYAGGELVYWLNDTHWNAAGAAIAAETLATSLAAQHNTRSD
jgi:hypothetical protein